MPSGVNLGPYLNNISFINGDIMELEPGYYNILKKKCIILLKEFYLTNYIHI